MQLLLLCNDLIIEVVANNLILFLEVVNSGLSRLLKHKGSKKNIYG